MPAPSDALRQAFEAVQAPVRFAQRSDRALASIRGLGDLVLRAAAVARALPLSAADVARVERLAAGAQAFDREDLEQRRARLKSLTGDLAGLTGDEPPAEPVSLPRVRSLAAQGSAAPVATEGHELQRSLSTLRGVGPAVAARLAARGLRTMGDVLLYLPRGYEDRRNVTSIGDLQAGRHALVRAHVVDFRQRFARVRMYELVVADDTGRLTARWFGWRPGAFREFVPDAPIILSGEVRQNRRGGLELVHPDIEVGDSWDDASFGRIVPVYTEVEGVSARHFRRIASRAVEATVDSIPDFLPAGFRRAHDLLDLSASLRSVHFPAQDAALAELMRFTSPSQRRLVFDELFFVQLGLALKKRGVQLETGIPMRAGGGILERAIQRLPFALTGAQARALNEVAADLTRSTPMNRLLQGDVGSGKTAVALAAALVAVENGFQAAFMAPTELLAEQHLRTFERLLGNDLFAKRNGLPPVRTGLLSAGRKARELERTKNEIASGTVRIVVGTQALIQEGVRFERLGLVIIDEQHRFGVLQRARLMEKGARPHVLVMTATPIPRTLALTLYGDLNVSLIDELPPGRTPVITRLHSGRTRAKASAFIREQVAAGRQAYVVLPLVEESEKLDLRAATEEAARLQAEDLAGLRVGLVHGRMGAEERNDVMERFRRGEVQVLVATTVIEVGVDVPNATVMLIEHAERFGLSQLHQLRGRVGRGAAKSYCLLMAEEDRSSANARERLGAMVRSNDGFRLAERDLEIRGPGEFLGTRQSGLPDLLVADLLRDQKILKEAREAAFALVADDPDFRRPEHRTIAAELIRRWAGKLSLARIG